MEAGTWLSWIYGKNMIILVKISIRKGFKGLNYLEMQRENIIWAKLLNDFSKVVSYDTKIVSSWLYSVLPDDAGKEDQDDGQEADPDGAHIERQCQP